ncbi:FmdB family transcriptional regulator [Kocuria sediminis]|uniref:FmdB family transcriptional regulator n=1 Tax=Kocuria sediminis TaxID=1038857 RepID=A0A6N8GEJ6_9MICC|nr:FmdB family zinc ribbon protein [Kocuria sediminis]MUN61561.1 FmdB family transcriptional regulator [Kocuria sediminis]
MPVYAYACKDCGHAFDIRQSFSEDALTACPECGGGLRKKFNTVGVVFKGSGFYRNDSRSDRSGTSSSSSAPAPAAADAAPAAAASATASSAPSSTGASASGTGGSAA